MPPRSSKIDPPFTFFLERSLGQARRATGRPLRARTRRDVAHPGRLVRGYETPDEVWLAMVGARGWVALAKDIAISKSELAQDAILAAGTAVFLLTHAQRKGEQTAALLQVAMGSVRRALRRCHIPLVAVIDGGGNVSVRWEEGVKLAKPLLIKRPMLKKGEG